MLSELGIRGFKVIRVILDRKVIREFRELRDLRELLGHKDIKDFREI